MYVYRNMSQKRLTNGTQYPKPTQCPCETDDWVRVKRTFVRKMVYGQRESACGVKSERPCGLCLCVCLSVCYRLYDGSTHTQKLIFRSRDKYYTGRTRSHMCIYIYTYNIYNIEMYTTKNVGIYHTIGMIYMCESVCACKRATG